MSHDAKPPGKRPWWKPLIPDSHTHKILILVIVILIVYLLIR